MIFVGFVGMLIFVVLIIFGVFIDIQSIGGGKKQNDSNGGDVYDKGDSEGRRMK